MLIQEDEKLMLEDYTANYEKKKKSSFVNNKWDWLPHFCKWLLR